MHFYHRFEVYSNWASDFWQKLCANCWSEIGDFHRSFLMVAHFSNCLNLSAHNSGFEYSWRFVMHYFPVMDWSNHLLPLSNCEWLGFVQYSNWLHFDNSSTSASPMPTATPSSAEQELTSLIHLKSENHFCFSAKTCFPWSSFFCILNHSYSMTVNSALLLMELITYFDFCLICQNVFLLITISIVRLHSENLIRCLSSFFNFIGENNNSKFIFLF